MKPVTHKHLIEHELEGFGIRCNKMPPKIKFSRKDKGGINLSTSVNQSEVTLEVCKQICAEYRCHCADIRITEDVTIDQLIDVRQLRHDFRDCVRPHFSALCCAFAYTRRCHQAFTSRPCSPCYDRIPIDACNPMGHGVPVSTPGSHPQAIEGNRQYIPVIYVLNKIDQISIEEVTASSPPCVKPHPPSSAALPGRSSSKYHPSALSSRPGGESCGS